MSQPLIIGCVSVAVLDTTINDIRGTPGTRAPAFRIIIGGFVVMVVLLALSDVNEELADGMALLIVLGVLFGPKGGSLSDLISKTTSKGYVPPASTGTSIVQLPTYVDPYAVWKTGGANIPPPANPHVT